MGVIAVLDQPFDHFTGIKKGFDQLLLHWRSPLNFIPILGLSANDLNSRRGSRRK
jgi:hypothetical protein